MNASEQEAREFLSTRGFSLRLHDEAGVFWADLTSLPSSQVVAERYGRGVDQTSAVVAAFNRYRLEQADWDTRGIELILQFTPTRTATHSLRLHVKDAFEALGLRIDSWTVPYGEDKALPGQLKWAEPSLDVTLKTIGDVRVLGRIAYPLGEALAAIRRTEPHLGFRITVKTPGQLLGLAFRVSDPAEAVREGMKAVSNTDFTGNMSWGWASDERAWVRI